MGNRLGPRTATAIHREGPGSRTSALRASSLNSGSSARVTRSTSTRPPSVRPCCTVSATATMWSRSWPWGRPGFGSRAHPRVARVLSRIGAPRAECCWWSTTRTTSSRRHALPARRSCLRSRMSMAGGSAGSRTPPDTSGRSAGRSAPGRHNSHRTRPIHQRLPAIAHCDTRPCGRLECSRQAKGTAA